MENLYRKSPLASSKPIQLAQVVASIIERPSELGPYIRDSVLSNRSPLEVPVPWLSYGAIGYLTSFLGQGERSVLELGSGGSTAYFAKHAASVTTFEDDSEWAERVEDRLDRQGSTNVTVERSAGQTWMEVAEALQPTVASFDVVVVDFSDQDRLAQLRDKVSARLATAMRSGSLLVLDDAWRYCDEWELPREHSHLEFPGLGPSRRVWTRTDIFVIS